MKLITTNSEEEKERGREGGDMAGKRLIDWKEGGESVRGGRREEQMNVWI